MHISFITEANETVGFGHLFRSVALAQDFINQGEGIRFFCDSSSCVDIITSRLENIQICETDDIKKIKQSDIIIIDVYKESFEEYSFLEKNSLKACTVSIVDYPFKDRALKTDFIFQIGYQKYKHKIELKENTTGGDSWIHSGSDFFIFREEFSSVSPIEIRENVDRVLVTMGGSDPSRITELVSQAVEALEIPLEVTYVFGEGIDKSRIKSISTIHTDSIHKVHFLQGIKNMAEVMTEHDMAIINGGSTRLELAALGIPFIAIAINDSQRKISDQIANDGIGLSLGTVKMLNPLEVASTIQKFLVDFDSRRKMSETMKKKIDLKSADGKIRQVLNQDIVFRKITDSELKIAYDLHCRVVEDLLKKDIRQWLRPIDFEKLQKRQNKKENYGLFIDSELQVFLSLVDRHDYHEWTEEMPNHSTIWLSTVSSSVDNEIKGIGKVAIKKAIQHLINNGINELYLDCVVNEGFLVNYYKKLGFKKLTQKDVEYRSGRFTVVLMKKDL